MSKVALVRCDSYDYRLVKQATEKGFDLLGGAGQFARPGEKILLKPNFLIGDPAVRCTNTHFAVFKAVVEMLQWTGAQLSYGDSPAFGSALNVAKKCGVYDVAQELGIPLVEFNEGNDIFFERGIQNRKFNIARAVLESDGVISLPKLKTHGLTFLTGAIKNQFGCVPGILKGEFHARLTDPMQFTQMLIDLNQFIKPRLYIMDGIMAMEGNGPRGGTPRAVKVLLFSSDPVALDATACRIVGVNPERVPIIRLSCEQGMGVYAENEIEILGDSLQQCQIQDFDMATEVRFGGTGFKKKVNDFLIKLLGGLLVEKPYIVAAKCVKCGVCIRQCPVTPKAVDWHDGVRTNSPSYKYECCIKCYCCQEVCPEGAIKLRTPLLRRLFGKKRK